MAVGVVGILGFMVMPLPTLLLDLLLSFNITFSLIILLASMYVQRPLELSAFPSILLLGTLFRLSLNVASTRIILLHGNEGTSAAGKVIMAFGGFVVGGNYLVGIIVFLILVVINFMVITKGAGRIAEVAARFTLDAMPGKQMSIDADLNAGMISEQEARNRRELISLEAEYYGAMDGCDRRNCHHFNQHYRGAGHWCFPKRYDIWTCRSKLYIADHRGRPGNSGTGVDCVYRGRGDCYTGRRGVKPGRRNYISDLDSTQGHCRCLRGSFWIWSDARTSDDSFHDPGDPVGRTGLRCFSIHQRDRPG
jgi:hypothetical protein